MSSARYFAEGVDYFRIVYDYTTKIDGPYVSIKSATTVGNGRLRHQAKLDKWYDREPIERSFKIQKLAPVFEECCCCLTLEWQDVES